MARLDVWLAYQREVIDSGVSVAMVVLEGPDAEVLQTWPIGYSNLESAVETELQSQREQLPKGKHQLKLIAKDSAGAQVAQLVQTIAGTSSAQTEVANSRLMQERANALQLSNVEKIQSLSRAAHEFSSELFESMRQGLKDRDERIRFLEELTQDQQLRIVRESAQQERMTLLAEKFAPTIEMGIAVAGQYLGEWIDKRQTTLTAARTAPKETPADDRPTSTVDVEPVGASVVDCSSAAVEPKTDATRCDQRDGQSNSRHDESSKRSRTKGRKPR